MAKTKIKKAVKLDMETAYSEYARMAKAYVGARAQDFSEVFAARHGIPFSLAVDVFWEADLAGLVKTEMVNGYLYFV